MSEVASIRNQFSTLAGRMERLEAVPELLTLEQLSYQYVRAVLACLDGNKSRAAKVLGIDRRALYRWLARANEAETAPIAAVG